jgi:regulator of sigma E protease
MDLLTFAIFFLALGGSIFLHELGHYVAARLAGIEVEEFGFGLPPRLLRFWRLKGQIVVAGQTFILPSNFELPFEREDGLGQGVNVLAEAVDEKLMVQSLELAATEDGQFRPTYPTMITRVDGRVQLSGILQKIEPGTEFTLNWLPLGGFVRPHGENDPNVRDGLSAANPWKRLGVLFAGPIMNLLTAIVVFAIIVALSGVAIPGVVTVASVEPESPAMQAGFLPGDVLLSLNGEPVSEIKATRTLIFANVDQTVTIVIERDGVEKTLLATPLSSRSVKQGALGIGLDSPRRPATLAESLVNGVAITGMQAINILNMPIMLIQGAISPEEGRLVGLFGMYNMFDQAVERDTETRLEAEAASATGEAAPLPSNYTLSLFGLLSVSLGVFNLLPIPALDGGRILFTMPELLFRRRIPYRFENAVNGIAFLLLLGLMLFVNLMDVIDPANFNLP